MNHLALLFICILSLEVLLYSNFIVLLETNFRLLKKASNVLLNKNISDHWKELVIPAYAKQLMKTSIKILLILIFVSSLFLIIDFFVINFLTLVFSLLGIIESLGFMSGYIFLRQLYKNE